MPPQSSARFRRNNSAFRRLQFEPLECRLALTADAFGSTGDLLAPLDPLAEAAWSQREATVQAAMAAITSTAPVDAIATVIDPAPIFPNAYEVPGIALTNAGPLIGLTAFQNDPRFAGVDGTGYSVVVIDTGIDLDHPFFGPDADGNGIADRIVYQAEFIGSGGDANDDSSLGHGTHVSSIIASQDATYGGMAPGLNIIALKVFGASGFGTAEGLESALQWAATHVDEYNIVGVNMSLGFGDNSSSPTARPELGLSDELAALAAQDVIVVSSSGNTFFSKSSVPGVAYPSSDPNSLSIGAVWSADAGGPYSWSDGASDVSTGADRIVSFSQRHPAVTTVMAPGAAITAAAIGGGTAVLSGTSMAAPMVTGVAALMQQLSVQTTGERLTREQFATYVADTGTPIFDGDDEDDNVTNTLQWYRRIDIQALADAVASGGLANLTVPGGVDVLDRAILAGGTARIDFTIANQGVANTGAFVTRVYLSADPQLDDSDTPLIDLTDNLASGELIQRSRLAVPIPTGLTPGTYYLIVAADDQAAVAEGNEYNNLAIQEITVSAGDFAQILLVDAATDELLTNGSVLLDFGQIFQGSLDAVKTLRLFNDGNVELVTTPLDVPAGYSASGFVTNVAPGASNEFSVSLVSSSDLGDYSGEISFQSNDADQSPYSLSVIGSVLEPDDHGNDAGHATAVTVESITNGRILRTGDSDWFSFQVVTGAQYHFATILQTLADSELQLFASDGVTVLAGNDDGPDGPASALDWIAPNEGVYYLEVKGVGAFEGDYQLAITVDDDHGDDAASSTFASDPSSTPGRIESVGDWDWFAFDAVAGEAYSFTALTSSLSAANLRLYDIDGATELPTVNNGPGDSDAFLSWTPIAAGTYYVVVAAAQPEKLGSYQLSITGNDDFGDNSANAASLAAPGTVAGALEQPSDADWFAFVAVAGARYRFDLSVDSAPTVGLRLIDRDGLAQHAADVAKPESPASIEWSAPTGGVFYIEASSLLGSTGAYDLEIVVVDDHGDDVGGATLISDPTSSPGAIELPGDRDWFAFDAEAGVVYHIEFEPRALAAARVRLIDSDGTTELETSGGPNESPAIDWTAPGSGVFFIEVASLLETDVGDYRLLLAGADDHGDNAQNATRLTVPLSVSGELDPNGDADWFVVRAVAGIEYRVETTVDTLPGARLRLVGPDGSTEISTAFGADGAPAGIHWTPTTTADYYFEIVEASFAAAANSAAPSPTTGAAAGGSYQIAVTPVSRLPGDYNGDLVVNGADFLAWQRQYGGNTPATTSTLDTEGFEQFSETLLNGQFEWKRLGPAAGTATVQSTIVPTGSRAVQIDRAAAVDNWWGVPLAEQAPSGEFVFVEWDMRASATGAVNGGLGPFLGVQAYDDAGGFGLLGSLGVDATTLDVVYQRQGDGVIVETGRKISADTWYRYGILFNFVTDQFTVYFERQPLVTNDFVDLNVPGANLDRLTDADLVALASQGDPASQTMTGTSYVDNFRIYQAATAYPFPADGNQDGTVDGLDLVPWQQTFGVNYASPGSPLAASAIAASIPSAEQEVVEETPPAVADAAFALWDAPFPLDIARTANGATTERLTASPSPHSWRPQFLAAPTENHASFATARDEALVDGDQLPTLSRRAAQVGSDSSGEETDERIDANGAWTPDWDRL
ncbi:MAG: S8 family serine peptidase [Planctomycetales bacterium]|nr:S8 family serine peptidase [Planctomycetales bacterium]